MSDPNTLLLKSNLKLLKLPTMLAEHDKLAREAGTRNESYDAFLLQLTELEVATRTANAIAARIRAAAFPVVKDLDTFDFTVTPSVPKQTVLELARGGWIAARTAA
jgi:DNA replication protein DnaC